MYGRILRELRVADFQPGVIIRFYDYSHAMGDYLHNTLDISSTPPEGSTETWAEAFRGHNYIQGPLGPIHLKERYGVVVWRFTQHHVILPLYTFRGDGVLFPRNNRAAAREFMSIRDATQPMFERQTANPVLDVQEWSPFMDPLDPVAAVHYTFPLSMDFRMHAVIAGWLTPDSTITLQNYYTHFSGAPFYRTRAELDAQAGLVPPQPQQPPQQARQPQQSPQLSPPQSPLHPQGPLPPPPAAPVPPPSSWANIATTRGTANVNLGGANLAQGGTVIGQAAMNVLQGGANAGRGGANRGRGNGNGNGTQRGNPPHNIRGNWRGNGN